MNKLQLEEICGTNYDNKNGAIGIVEFIIKDREGKIVEHRVEKNIIKVFAKEMLAHRIPSSKIWDINANSGAGGWVDSGIDPTEEFSIRYMLFGASFDENGTPLGNNDPRYYAIDTITGQYVPIRLSPAADYDGGLINSIPIEEPVHGLKRIEGISFRSTYQPAGSPLVDSGVRAVNNILQVETTLRLDEYNGFTSTTSDFFSITEVALCGGKLFDTVPFCGLKPEQLFLEGEAIEGTVGEQVSIKAVTNGTNIVTIDLAESTSTLLLFKTGDQIKIVNEGGTQSNHTTLDQVNPYYLVTNYNGGRDIELDRVPVTSSGAYVSGNVGIFRSTLRVFSHRILNYPVKKTSNFEIKVVWSIVMS
jgi:hypothetical protein